MKTSKKKILITGATGYVASQILPYMVDNYETVLLDTRSCDRAGKKLEGINVVDLIDSDRSKYSHFFENVDGVIHLAYKRRSGIALDHYYDEKDNVSMAYNVLRCSYDYDVKRVVMASSNHAADWYEHALIHEGRMENLEPSLLPLSDNFYGWAKATYEHLGFLFACGGMGEGVDGAAQGNLIKGNLGTSRKMGVVMVRIGAPRELEFDRYRDDPKSFIRDLGAYISRRDITQLFCKAIETSNINNQYGVPWQVVYGISNNARSFWSLTTAREILGYHPKDDSEFKFRTLIKQILHNEVRRIPDG